MEIGIVGAGKVGCSIGKYLCEHGRPVAGYFSRSKESVEFAATFTGTKGFSTLEELTAASSILFIATPDDTIFKVWEEIKKQSIQGKIICHFSGSLSSVVFSDIEQTGASGCSIHPMYAFSNKKNSYEKLNSVLFTAEGEEAALAVVVPLFRQLGNSVSTIHRESKARYHAAASMVSNMMVGLYQMGVDMLVSCGMEEDEAGRLVKPLVKGNMETVLSRSPKEALTGPIERNDIGTVEKHLAVLSRRERDVYEKLGQMVVEIAKKKNPDRDYTAISDRLRMGGSR